MLLLDAGAMEPDGGAMGKYGVLSHGVTLFLFFFEGRFSTIHSPFRVMIPYRLFFYPYELGFNGTVPFGPFWIFDEG